MKKIFLLGLLLGSITYGVYYFKKSPFFKIRNIQVYGGGVYVNENDVYKMAEKILDGRNILAIKSYDVEVDIKKNFLGAKEIFIEKDLPDSIKIKIEERVPLAVVKNNEEYLVDEDGYVLGLASERIDLPRLKYSEEVKIGDFISKDIIPASSEIIKYASQEEVDVSSVSFYPKYAHLYVDGSINVFINNESNKLLGMKVLKRLIEEARVLDRKLKKIDLRYDKVIVLYE